MKTLPCLPNPDSIPEFITAVGKIKTYSGLADELNVDRKTLSNWKKEPWKASISALQHIVEFSRINNLPVYQAWVSTVLADDYPVVTIREEWHEPHTKYVCKRLTEVPTGWMIICQNELCRHFVNDQGEHQALSTHNDSMYKMDAPPDHHVLGKLTPIESEE